MACVYNIGFKICMRCRPMEILNVHDLEIMRDISGNVLVLGVGSSGEVGFLSIASLINMGGRPFLSM